MITTSNSSSKQQITIKGLKKYLEAQRKAYVGWGIFAEPGVFKQVEPKPDAEKLSPDTEPEESMVHRS